MLNIVQRPISIQRIRHYAHAAILLTLLFLVACEDGGLASPTPNRVADRSDGLLTVEVVGVNKDWLIPSRYYFFARVINLDVEPIAVQSVKVLASPNIWIDGGRAVDADRQLKSVSADATEIARFAGACHEEGPASISVQVVAAGMDGERRDVTVDGSINCLPWPESATTSSSGDVTAVEVIAVDGERFPISQFIPIGDNENGVYWSTEFGQLVFPISGEDEWQANPDPDGEGFGLVEETQSEMIIITVAAWEQFCGEVTSFTSRQSSDGYDLVMEHCQQSVILLEFGDDLTAEPTAGTRPTATPATRGVLVTVLKIGDAHYYIHQFDHLRSPGLPNGEPGHYLCGDNQYAVHLSGFLNVARSFEYPDEPIEDPDVTGCGFGFTEEFADPESAHSSVLQADFPQARFTAKVIGEWCRRVLPDLAGQNPAIQNLCDRNPPQD